MLEIIIRGEQGSGKSILAMKISEMLSENRVSHAVDGYNVLFRVPYSQENLPITATIKTEQKK